MIVLFDLLPTYEETSNKHLNDIVCIVFFPFATECYQNV